MIKFFMRRTIYKEFDRETQDILLQLDSKQYIIETLCFMFWIVAFIYSFIPLFIIECCEDMSMITQMAIIVFMLICFAGMIVFIKIFKKAMIVFSQLLAEKIYFLVCTKRGKAICENEFNIIKQTNKNLYKFITTQMCRGYCYSISFDICKALEKGSIEFLAIKTIPPHCDEEDFTMHVIYVNNGWAFDTYSSCQYPIEKLREIYKAKIYKSFSFDEISSKSYEEFMDEQEPELLKWSLNNDCSMFWKGDKEDT